MSNAISVYLDSQDYSRMSDNRAMTGKVRQIRDELLFHAASADVRFVFSGTIISEMTPLSAEYAGLASGKADLLFELCGQNTLVSMDHLVDMEVTQLLHKSTASQNAISDDATWFPRFTPDMSPARLFDLKKMLVEILQEQGKNRSERREIMRKSFKGNVPTPAFRALLNAQDVLGQTNALLESYPMRPEDAIVWVQYGLGQATEKQLNEALLSSLRDPRWMMRWFSTKHHLATPMIEWVRDPAKQMGDAMRKMSDYARAWVQIDKEHNNAIQLEMATPKGWSEQRESQILNVVSRLIEPRFPGRSSDIANKEIEMFCPGIVSMIRSFYSALWDSVGGNRSELPSDSQSVDAMHAVYAPYVDVFRADRYMAPHIRKQVERHGTRVASRLEEVPEILSELLLQRRMV